MTQIELYKSVQFVLELLVAESLFLCWLRRRSYFWLKLPLGIALIFAVSFAVPVSNFSNNAFYMSLVFLTIFAATVAVGVFCFKESVINVIFCCVAGYTTQHVAYELYNLSLNIMGVNSNAPMGFYGTGFSPTFSLPILTILYFYIYIVAYAAAFLVVRKQSGNLRNKITNISLFVAAVLLVLVDILLNALVVYNIASDGNRLYLVVVGGYNIICCVIGLYLQFEVVRRRELESELNVIKTLHQKEKLQYESSRETVDFINMRFHDLRHQLHYIDGNNANATTAGYVKDLDNLITLYDATVKTGNEALDVILTEKHIQCIKNNIRLSCIADGTHLSFMKAEDIYSLFGNMLDNAIDAVSGLAEEQRVIGLTVKTVGNLVSINEHNYCSAELKFADKLPVTTKKGFGHGYGMRSIRYICNNYGAEMSVDVHDGIFEISILVNCPTTK